LIYPDFERCGELDVGTPSGLAALALQGRRHAAENTAQNTRNTASKNGHLWWSSATTSIAAWAMDGAARGQHDLAAQVALLPALGPQALVVQEGVLTLERIN
jgi:hypothetical protein